MANFDQDPDKWLRELFEWEYCEECGGDARHHTAISLLGPGNWFAVCDYPPDDDGNPHPVVARFRAEDASWPSASPI